MSSWFKYVNLFFVLSGMAKRIGQWYSTSTAPGSEGGEDITPAEWTALVDAFTASVAEAFGMDPGAVRGSMKDALKD